ncbi:rCG44431, partial [Rattus norvegicus]
MTHAAGGASGDRTVQQALLLTQLPPLLPPDHPQIQMRKLNIYL